MSQLTQPASKLNAPADDPAYLAIADQLDAIGQRYRVQRLVRGIILWITAGLVVSLAAAMIAHLIGAAWPADGGAAKAAHPVAAFFITATLFCWIAFLIASAVGWVVLPLAMRPRDLQIARMVESRVTGLHNGLTNSVLLAQAQDLQHSPFLPAIFDEISRDAEAKPLNSAVKFSDLRVLFLVAAGVILPVMLLLSLPSPRGMFMHGLKQMFSPHAFVPETGAVDELKVQPGDVLMIAGQPLEIGVSAHAARKDFQPDARLIIESTATNPPSANVEATLNPTISDPPDGGSALGYGYRLDRVENSLRYRVEVAGTQSPWFNVKVVKQVKLRELSLVITPPLYTRKPPTQLTLQGDQIAKSLAAAPISAPQGSRLQIDATVDLPVQAAMLQIGDNGQTAMSASQANQHFSAETTILDQASLSILLMEGSQVIARLPEDGISVQCIKDTPPAIELQWPAHDLSVPPNAELTVKALLKDDYGISSAQILMAPGSGSSNAQGDDQPLAPIWSQQYGSSPTTQEVSQVLNIKPELRKHGQSIRVQLTATDNRDLTALMKSAAASAGSSSTASADSGGPQTTSSAIVEIKFSDPAQIAAEEKEKLDQIRAQLMKMLATQKELNGKSINLDGMLANAAKKAPAAEGMLLEHKINAGQGDLRSMMQQTADTFSFDDTTRIVQKTLQIMAGSVAREAIDLSAAILTEPIVKEQTRDNQQLQSKQRQIITTLESLLAVLDLAHEPATQPTVKGSPSLPSEAEKWKKLDEALKAFMKEEQRILDQTAALAKKPVDDLDDNDKKLLDQLKQSQDKMDAFMQQALSDFSKNAEQDMSNPALLKDLLAVYSEVTMAKDALNKQSTEIAVSDEEMGLEGAKEISSNIEKWLSNTPDRQQWTQEDPVAKTDTPMPELPTELEDMVGKLLEQQEDLNQEQEDANANWADSMDKGVGWDAADGPIADMSAKGVTGNTLPNDNEMGGRSGEGRSGKSQGEFVGDSAQGKGGRNTPTRLDPTPFQKGQINDQSKDPVGGATGGGKLSGQGAAGLEGPVPPKVQQEMQRLANKQAQIRNAAERLLLNYHLGKYDNFNLYQAIILMRRNESNLQANRYQNSMRDRDVIVDDLGSSKMLLGGNVDVERDATPDSNAKMREDINDAMKGDLPAAWSDALKEYYKKLAEQ